MMSINTEGGRLLGQNDKATSSDQSTMITQETKKPKATTSAAPLLDIAAKKSKGAATATSSLPNSPLLPSNNGFKSGFSHPNGESISSEQDQQMSHLHRHSPSTQELPSSNVQASGFNVGVNGSGMPLSNAINVNNGTRASTSTLPTNTSLHLKSLPTSAQMIAAHQAVAAANAAAAAVAASSSSHHYHTNGFRSPTTASSSSTPSSSSQATMQNNYYLQHQLQQQLTYEKHTVELTNCIIAFLSPILPTEEEYRIKEATRRQLERLAGRVSPGAKLLAFGSMANGFALRNSDMDLCCLIAAGSDSTKATPHSASELVEVLGKLIREETDYTVMPLPKARIPIIKITRASTAEVPYEIACDIGFENRLALENTRLLLSYAMVDPPRLRTLVLFLKVWTKRRKLNSPYTGTLSSYGYTLMMIFFLSQVKRPAVLPNLQRIPSSSSSKRAEEVTLNGHNTYFYDDVATLRKEWTSFNTENVGELLIDFFRYFSKDFAYSKDVISIRTENGLISKDGHTWSAELCIEDPFQSGYNVARTVTRDGLYTIRGEFMRASRILTTRPDSVSKALAELCEEREDGLSRAPDLPYHQRHRASFAAAGSAAMYNAALANGMGGGYDARHLRDLARRYDLSNNSVSGLGGSFAFEEMARGLGQAQKSSNVIAYPPTTAMLAPLSQNTGLSPRNQLMRAGLRYDTPRRGQSGSPMNNTTGVTTANHHLGSSARSEDGGSNYEKKKSKKGSVSSNVSARTSPNLGNAVSHGFINPNTPQQTGVGEALAYGSEISFGSQRFQLHPQSSSAASTSRNSKATITSGSRVDSQQNRSLRSFSDGLNRSMSLPRSGGDGNEVRRSSTPLLSEPASPSNRLANVDLPAQNGLGFLEPAMTTLSVQNGHYPSSPRSSISESSGGGRKGIGMRLCNSQPIHPAYNNTTTTTTIRGLTQQSQQSSSSPRLPPSPWSFDGQNNDSRDSQTNLTPEEEGSSFALDDDPISIADDQAIEGVSSTFESIDDQQQGEGEEEGMRVKAMPKKPSHVKGQVVDDDILKGGKENDVRTWAATQSLNLSTHTHQGQKDKTTSNV